MSKPKVSWSKTSARTISLANILERLFRFVCFARFSLYSVFVAVLDGMLSCVRPALERPLSHLPKQLEP